MGLKNVDSPPQARKQVFVSYSRRDKKYRERLEAFLGNVESVEAWIDESSIEPGEMWRRGIEEAIDRCQIAVVLVSVNLMASRFIREHELPSLVAKAEAGKITLLPVSLGRAVVPESLDQFQWVNDRSRPLSSMSEDEQDQVWLRVAQAIERWEPPMTSSRPPEPPTTSNPDSDIPSEPSLGGYHSRRFSNAVLVAVAAALTVTAGVALPGLFAPGWPPFQIPWAWILFGCMLLGTLSVVPKKLAATVGRSRVLIGSGIGVLAGLCLASLAIPSRPRDDCGEPKALTIVTASGDQDWLFPVTDRVEVSRRNVGSRIRGRVTFSKGSECDCLWRELRDGERIAVRRGPETCSFEMEIAPPDQTLHLELSRGGSNWPVVIRVGD